MKRIYKPNYKGFLILPRAIQFFFQNTALRPSDLGYFISFITQLDFDPRHELYTVLLRDDSQLATMWNVHQTTVSRQKKDLIEKGFLQQDQRGYLTSNLLPLFLSKNSSILASLSETQMKAIFTNHQESPEELVNKIAKMHFYPNKETVKKKYKDPKSRFSSKSDLSQSVHDEDIDPEDIPF